MLFISSQKRFVFKIFKFLSWILGHVAKRLEEKDEVNFKIYNSQPGYQTIVMHILLNILWSKTIRQWNLVS